MIKKFSHVGIAVKDLDKFIAFYEQTFDAKLQFRVVDDKAQFESAGMTINEAQFEVLCSTSPGSMIDKHIQARGEGMHHVSLQVENFDETIKDLKAKGLKIIGEVDTPQFKAAFIHPASNFGILTEIYEPKG